MALASFKESMVLKVISFIWPYYLMYAACGHRFCLHVIAIDRLFLYVYLILFLINKEKQSLKEAQTILWFIIARCALYQRLFLGAMNILEQTA